MRRTAVVLASAALLSGGLVTTAPPALAVVADSASAVPLNGFSDMLVDDAHGHVFLAGAPGDPLVVRDLDGGAVSTIPDQPGASQMSLSPDGSRVYVALASVDAISAIDTTTLVEVARYATGSSTCPSSVAATGTKVWFGYGCTGGSANLGVLSPSGAGTVTLATRPAGTWSVAPTVVASPADSGRLAIAERSSPATQLAVYDVSSGTPAVVASRSMGGLQDLAWSRDGNHVLTASWYVNYHGSFLATDLSADGAYAGPNHISPNAVAAGPGGVVAAGLQEQQPGLRTYLADGTKTREYFFGDDVGYSPDLVPGGLAYDADGTRLLAVTYVNGTVFTLRVLRNPPLAPTGFSIFTPATRTVNQTSTITGQVRTHLAPPVGSVITLQRDSVDGVVDLPSVTTGAQGTFTFTDKPTRRGVYGYTASWAGDAEHLPSSRRVEWVVNGITPSLSITRSVLDYTYGARVPLTVHLGATPGSAVDVWAKPYGATKTLVAHGTTDAHGDFRTSYVVTRYTELSATYGGSDTYEPTTGSLQAFSYARMLSSYSGYYGTSGSYKLFRATVDPKFLLTVLPNNAHATVDFTIQTYTASTQTWHTRVHATRQLDAYSKSSLVFVSSYPAGTRFRINAHLPVTNLNLATMGPWLYGMFTT